MRSSLRAFALAITGTAVLIAGAAGCAAPGAPGPTPSASSPSSSISDPDPSAVVSSLGAVPIPPTTAPDPTPSASAGHPALSAAGGPIAMGLGSEGRALVTVLGPAQANDGQSAGPASKTRAYLTLQVRQSKGSAVIKADELTSRDETGRLIPLTPDGPKTITTHPGGTSSLKLVGTFESGAAQVTWRHHGKVLAVWTFNVELD